MRLDRHGDAGACVIVLHGGPGAPGSASGLARGLAAGFRVLEPWQRGSADGGPLTVAQHIDDLLALTAAECPGERPALVGHSWGAMLALATAAAQPAVFGALALVGCGTFDEATRTHYYLALEQRGGKGFLASLAALDRSEMDPDRRLLAKAERFDAAFGVDLLPEPSHAALDAHANAETWADMLRLQAAGVYPAAFAAIRVPVLMLHGAEDPHPGRLIRDSLLPFLPQLEYCEFRRCGHYPWRERAARTEFLALLAAWLRRQST